MSRGPSAAAAGDDHDYVDSYEDVSQFVLSSDREATLLAKQTECTFMWTTSDGDPVGVVMNFVWHEGQFFLTCTRRRKRVPAILARPRVAVAITSRGTDIGISQAVTYVGACEVRDDEPTRTWMYRALAEKVRPGSDEAARSKQEAFVHHLDSPGRVVIVIAPERRIGFDSEAMFANSPAGATTTQV
jgi:hypothetical protein